MQVGFYRQIFGEKKIKVSNFMIIRPVLAQLFHADRQTGRRDKFWSSPHRPFLQSVTSFYTNYKYTQHVKYIYLSPITSYMFRWLLHYLQGDPFVIVQKLYAFCSTAVKCTIYPGFKFTIILTMFQAICISPFCILKILIMLVL